MELHELSFGKAIVLAPDMAEIIVNEGVEMDLPMVDEYHTWIAAHLSDPCVLLVNKLNAYTYTFEAQARLATLPQIAAMAVIAYRRSTQESTGYLASVPRDKPWNLRIFINRYEALAWLATQRA